MNDDEIRGLFSEMGGEEIPAESLARVRRAVGAAVEARRRTFGWWKVAVMLAAAGCLAVVLVKVRTVAQMRLPVVAAGARGRGAAERAGGVVESGSDAGGASSRVWAVADTVSAARLRR